MFKKEISYKDFDDVQRTEEFHFHLSEADLIEIQIRHGEDDIQAWIKKVVETRDGAQIMDFFKMMLRISVGKRQGNHFVKNDQIANDFLHTNAYSMFFMELVQDSDAGAKFINGIMPSGVDLSSLPDISDLPGVSAPEAAKPELPKYQLENRKPTDAEIREMSKEELQKAFAWRPTEEVQASPEVL